MKDDQRVAAAVDECCRRVRDGETLEQCLSTQPMEYRATLAQMVPLALRVGGLGRDPSPRFRANFERRLLAAVESERRARHRALPVRIGRFVAGVPLLRAAAVALVVCLVLVAGGVTVTQAAEDSLPDSPLYQVKRAREWVQLLLARDPEGQVGVRATQIAKRGLELELAVVRHKPRAVVDISAVRLARSTELMVDQALLARARGNPQPPARALAALRLMQRALPRLEARAAPEVRPALERLRSFLNAQEQRLL